MGYKCSQCGYTAEQAGNCPTCNVPTQEEEKEAPSEETSPKETSSEPSESDQTSE